MNQFDNEISSTLKEIAERVETQPYLKDKIDKELLRRCPEYRKKIAVIFGGCSPEYSVSLQSAYSIISHIDTEKYTPVLIGISQSGDWFLYEGDIEKIVSDTWCGGKDCTPVVGSFRPAGQRAWAARPAAFLPASGGGPPGAGCRPEGGRPVPAQAVCA